MLSWTVLFADRPGGEVEWAPLCAPRHSSISFLSRVYRNDAA